jgi:hypothetical protein
MQYRGNRLRQRFGRGSAGVALLFGLVLGSVYPAAAGQNEIVIDRIRSSDLEVEYFTLEKDQSVRIEAVGAEYQSGFGMFAYPWIIDSETRNLVWSMDEDVYEEVEDSPWLREFDDEIRMRRGSYELYYYAGQPSMVFSDMEFESFSEFMDNLDEAIERLKEFYDEDTEELDMSLTRLAREYFVRVSGEHMRAGRGESIREMLVAVLEPENNAYEQVSFALSEETELEIYSIGEYWSAKDEMVDWGWIEDARTGKHVWDMDYDNTDLAGGAEKNRRFRGRLSLPEGEYTVHYVTDDSHTYDGWNSAPPYDPDGWGIRVYPVRTADRENIEVRAGAPKVSTIVRLAGIGDNELVSRAFRLSEPAKLQIYALGEYSRYQDHMVDYGWVESLDDDEKTVWIMSGSNTEPAGGDDKNRQFCGAVQFEPGEYVVWYASDGSHSYGDGWNASPPHDQKAYGITISLAEGDLDKDVVKLIDIRKDQPHGQLISVMCDEDDSECEGHFTLASAARVRIRGMGEGSRHGMVDYGWIENRNTGDIVWEMTYRKTRHAGGAEKNREVDQIILMDKGKYSVYFVTDGSHSPEQWNSEPPDPPVRWGIRITRVEGDGL